MPEFLILSREVITEIKQLVCWLLVALILIDLKFNIPRRLRQSSFAVLGIAGGLLWWNLLQFHYPARFHYWDYYHYYVGAKYIDEIGYSNLYRCSIIAQSEAGLLESDSEMMMRELRDNSYVPVSSILNQAEICKAPFSSERWAEFSSDVLWFRQHVGDLWERIRFDHGFNASPAWLIAGQALVKHTAPSDRLFHFLSTIDDLLLLLLWSIFWRIFGAIPTSVALVYWGTNTVADYAWTGGAFLRHDWFFCLGIGLAFMRRGRDLAAGMSFAAAAALRIFPALVPFFVLTQGFVEWIRNGFRLSFAQNHRLIAGLLLATVIILPFSMLTLSRPGIWQEFAGNLQKHSATRTGNSVGLSTIIANVVVCRYGDKRDPGGQCDLGEKISGDASEGIAANINHLGQFLALSLFIYISRRTVRWKLAVLSVGMVPFLTSASSYYLEMLAFIGLLYADHRSVGLLLCALALISQYVSGHVAPANKVHLVNTVFILQFVACVVYVVCVPPAIRKNVN